MPASTRSKPAASQQGANASRPAQVLRFVAGAHEHREPIISQTYTLGATVQQSNPSNIPIPAYGFIAHVILLITWTGGVGALAADAPWNIINSVAIQDVNGAFLQNPIDGFAMLQENVYGGYSFRGDPRLDYNYSAAATSGQFMIRVPVQVTRHNAYGALANQNAAATYQLVYTINTFANVYSTATTAPTVTVQAYLEAWTQPNARDLKGRPQSLLPPMHGSTQQWSQYTKAVAVGNNVVQFPRVGNTIRAIVIIARNASNVRADNVLLDPFTLNVDSRVLTSEGQMLRFVIASEALDNGGTRDVGVLAFLFNNSILGKAGDESSDLWYPTLQSTRLEYDGNAAAAGNYQIITCDIAQVEVDQAARYVQESATGDLQNPIVDRISA